MQRGQPQERKAPAAQPAAAGNLRAQEAAAVRDMLDTLNEGEDANDAAVEAAESTFRSRVTVPVKIIIALSVVASFFISMMLGRYPLMPDEVLANTCSYFSKVIAYTIACLQDPSFVQNAIDFSSGELVLFHIRLPRILVVMLVGAALSVAGASYQGMFKNPLTSPDLLGASAGASLGACVALLLGMPGGMVQLLAFTGGIVAVALAVWLNRFVDYDPTLGLVLAGILVSTLFQSGMSLVKFMADADDKLPTITFWLMGSFATVNLDDLALCLLPMVFGFAVLLFQSWKLNVLSFGDEEARAMGVNTKRTRLIVIFASTLVTTASVAVAGIVGWIGLVIPHLARAIVGPNYKALLPTSMFVGAVYLLIVDNIARLLTTVEIPIGILTAILGVPFFIFIFKRNMKGWR